MHFISSSLAALTLSLLAGPGFAGSGEHNFQAPSGNIHCVMQTYEEPQNVRCDFIEGTVTHKKRPKDCELDYGQAFYLDARGRGEVACHGDTVINRRARVLNYGESLNVGGVWCTSERTGMTCRNTAGHGFSIARAKQHVF
ncbi:DUF6636 domain-containing protein [Falsigemmobacter faecalis]|uniref:Uncharacterized protein n=1 Tax=Falsigemmobacter faecalis TaxID=2488730 RepID=A0A3P3DNL9_9RHOB|nr:DUF6636 domain-containing protein [Falsigemmobacter faecalis]RRH75837.1 hypothetical protein EG244_07895 [Falsigemmobacter faecalis]